MQSAYEKMLYSSIRRGLNNEGQVPLEGEEEDQIVVGISGRQPLVVVTVVASVSIMTLSVWQLILVSRSTVKQRERGSAFFALPIAMAALASILLVIANVLQILSDAGQTFDTEVVSAMVGLGLCLGTLSLSSFLLAWSLAASLATSGIAATHNQWIKAFRIVVRVQSVVPLVDFIFAMIAGYAKVLTGFTYIPTFTNSLILIAVTMPWLSCKLRGLAIAKSHATAGAESSLVVARLLDLQRAARNSAALSICVMMACFIYTFIYSFSTYHVLYEQLTTALSEPFIVPLVGTTLSTALILPLHNVSVGLRRLLRSTPMIQRSTLTLLRRRLPLATGKGCQSPCSATTASRTPWARRRMPSCPASCT